MQIVQQEAWIKERAYAIWEQEGRPSGRERQHWFQAAAEAEQMMPAISAEPAKPAAKTGRSAKTTAKKAPAKPRKAA